MRRLAFLILVLGCACAGTGARADGQPPVEGAADGEQARIGLHGQLTSIRQFKPAFTAPYSGPNSLDTAREWSYSRTFTADVGVRPWPGAQVHLNPEAASGIPLSRLTGAAGISNGELQRGASPMLRSYMARLYLQQRLAMGGPVEHIGADFNELGESTTQRRWTVVAGTFSLLDFMDPNPYAKDPREQFTNWSFLTHGAWDYPADARGYTAGALAEYRTATWSVRFGRAAQPLVSNGPDLDRNLRRQWGDFVEADTDLPWHASGGPLRARLLLFRNRINGGNFGEALALGQATNAVPDVGLVRRPQDKTGWGVTLEAPLGEGAGLFLRASANNGRVETYAFTEIDRQLAIGGQFTGSRWSRPQDRWGVAAAFNGLSGPHRSYLAAGGRGAFLGDGRLAYAGEQVVEGWYRWTLPSLALAPAVVQSALSAGLQVLRNPGHNGDREGPVRVWMVRFHADF
jgi:high affinity Mn2+ porin